MKNKIELSTPSIKILNQCEKTRIATLASFVTTPPPRIAFRKDSHGHSIQKMCFFYESKSYRFLKVTDPERELQTWHAVTINYWLQIECWERTQTLQGGFDAVWLDVALDIYTLQVYRVSRNSVQYSGSTVRTSK